jgi:YD repeat-containing protein
MATSKRIVGIAVILALLVASGVPFLVNTSPAVAETENPYLVGTFVDEDGRKLDIIIDPGRPPEVKMAAVEVPEPRAEMGINTLSDVPAFDWSYGCSPTSAAMMGGYYDRIGYSNMYAGPTNGGVCPLDNTSWGSGECPLSATHQGYDGLATRGHVDDYYFSYLSTNDPYYGNWTEHGYADCTADFMGTSQYQNWLNRDGSTTFVYDQSGDPLYDYTGHEPTYRDGCHGLRLFIESRGYSVATNFNQYIYGQAPLNPNNGFTFANFMAEIDAGRPVLIHIEEHTMLGFGYNTSGNLIYIHDTWDHGSHTMPWGGTYDGRQHYAVTVIRLTSAPSPPAAPTLSSPANGSNQSSASVAFQWNTSSGANDYYLYVRSTGGVFYAAWLGNVTSKTLGGFPNDGTVYYWSVYARNAGGLSPQSDIWNFTNGTGAPPPPPAAPTLSSPANGSDQASTSVAFQWNTSSGANDYYLYVRSTGGVFYAAWLGKVTSKTLGGFPNDGTVYYWSVYARNADGLSPQSDIWSFTNGT